MKQILSRRLTSLLAAAALASGLLVACGGGGGSGSTAGNTDAIISGVAAVGAPLANAAIVVKDANNETVEATADANGSYSANVSGKTAPFMIKATGVVAGVSTSYYSALDAAPTSGETLTANVTPLTHAIVAQSSSGDPATVFADVKAKKSDIATAKVQAAKAKLLAALNDYIVALGGIANADPITTKFNANSTDALDKVLDLVKINTQVVTANGSTTADVSLTVNGGATTTVTQANTSTEVTSKKLAPPNAEEIALDTSGIKTLFSGFNAAFASSTAYGTNGANFAALLDADILDQGQTKTAFVSQVTSTLNGTTSDLKWGAKFEIPVIERCEAASKICWVQMTLNKGSNVFEKFGGAVKQDAATKKWLFYGDRRAFDFSTSWVAQKQADGTYRLGMNVFIPFNNDQPLTQAVLSLSFDSGNTTSASNDLYFGRPANTCGNNSAGDYLVASGECNTNFVALTDTKINEINTAITAGTFRYKIVLSNNGLATGAKTQNWVRLPPNSLGVTSATVNNFASSFPSITTNQLGTSSVAFSGAGKMEDVQIRVKTNGSVTGDTRFGGDARIAGLGGTVTVAKANASCKANHPSNTSACDASYGANGIISWVLLTAKDAQGRSFWAAYGSYN